MQRKSRRGERWLDGIGGAYVGVVALWLALRLALFDGVWWLALLNSFALALLLPTALLLPLALWRRRLRLAAALALPVAAFGWLFGALLLPGRPPPAAPAATFTAMSFNVLWSNQDYDRIAGAIAAVDPDVVALQELRPEHLPALRARLGAEYPYASAHPVEQFHTVGLLSRFPIEEVTVLADPPFERALLVRLAAAGRPLALVVAHLTPTQALSGGLARLPATVAERYARREQQAAALLAAVGEARPAVVLCDCNFTDTSEAYAIASAGLVDSFAEAGWGFGHTMLAPWVGLPAERLDYIWHTPELTALEAWVGPDGGSDHLPVAARLAWP